VQVEEMVEEAMSGDRAGRGDDGGSGKYDGGSGE
jgi:hypothetical protein